MGGMIYKRTLNLGGNKHSEGKKISEEAYHSDGTVIKN